MSQRRLSEQVHHSNMQLGSARAPVHVSQQMSPLSGLTGGAFASSPRAASVERGAAAPPSTIVAPAWLDGGNDCRLAALVQATETNSEARDESAICVRPERRAKLEPRRIKREGRPSCAAESARFSGTSARSCDRRRARSLLETLRWQRRVPQRKAAQPPAKHALARSSDCIA